jgi:DNA-binding NtrC family response regulator
MTYSTQKKHVLYVEGSDAERSVVTSILAIEDGTYTVIPVRDGATAIGYVESALYKPAIMISEFHLPDGGLELFKMVEKYRIFMVCVTSAPRDAEAAFRRNGLRVPVVPKPFDCYRVLSSIDHVLSQSIANSVRRQWDF